VVLGFGLNVAMARDELPVPTATSLLLAGLATDKSAVVAGVLAGECAGLIDRFFERRREGARGEK
jgi:BirA family biotin operon repressor/biotin-[acetyl-CoA-carboxylase] ligase